MQKMNEDQFKDWKEHAEFFFGHLRKKQAETSERMESIGIQLADCNPEDVTKIHKLATIIGAQSELLGQIISLEYEDIFDDDEDHTA